MPLTLYPAIDLKDGKCVRLRRGAMEEATVYADDPAAQARAWEDAGFAWLHVVDLNGAFAGRPVNAAAVNAILGAVQVPVQLGGGIRYMAGIEAWLAAGVRRVILGSAAVENSALVQRPAAPSPIALPSASTRAMAWWLRRAGLRHRRLAARELAVRFEDAGAAAIIYTDISRDGMLTGVNIGQTVELARHLTTPVIASGGVGGLQDLAALRQAAIGTPIEGVIIGRALYDGRIEPAEALALHFQLIPSHIWTTTRVIRLVAKVPWHLCSIGACHAHGRTVYENLRC